jgi:hypothetical protein
MAASHPRRAERAWRGVGPWSRETVSQTGTDRLVEHVLERQAALAHGALDEQARVGIERERRAHPDAS